MLVGYTWNMLVARYLCDGSCHKGQSRALRGHFYDSVGWDIALSAYQLLCAENKTDRISGELIQVSFNSKLLLSPLGGCAVDVIVLFPVLNAIKRSRGPVIISGPQFNANQSVRRQFRKSSGRLWILPSFGNMFSSPALNEEIYVN